eukprot:CAMPEP_0175039790 /NCGR_PEP_ID=MMETSP0052_2-20121109/837_1 /TAXON_ID=51329 ORGANISM="Polytomella parva, Strain SAG 63-3" /NCGR_SAMPLE_ID=MMETSP0052_2 /ASSEMBLY_ACC=CAM_ASM_000194 /LENGTH=456 /DNA_ID=CAMNT_0016301797 /DNA_START=445 /DNA_END=1815 /DNA_ORIENTATION=+
MHQLHDHFHEFHDNLHDIQSHVSDGFHHLQNRFQDKLQHFQDHLGHPRSQGLGHAYDKPPDNNDTPSDPKSPSQSLYSPPSSSPSLSSFSSSSVSSPSSLVSLLDRLLRVEHLTRSHRPSLQTSSSSPTADSPPPPLSSSHHPHRHPLPESLSDLSAALSALAGSIESALPHRLDEVQFLLDFLNFPHLLNSKEKKGDLSLPDDDHPSLSSINPPPSPASSLSPPNHVNHYDFPSFSSPYASRHWPVEKWPIYVFLMGVMICLLTSSICHLFGCCQAHIALIIWRFDYAGIAILIVSSFYPTVWYGFLCHSTIRWTYLLVTTFMGVATVMVTLLEVFQTTAWRSVRAGLFVALGGWGAIPLLHSAWMFWDVEAMRKAFWGDIIMGACYVIGAMVYATRIPERWLPGKFDVLFHSHQIFHVLIVIAAYFHFGSTFQLLNWRDEVGGCLSSSLLSPRT